MVLPRRGPERRESTRAGVVERPGGQVDVVGHVADQVRPAPRPGRRCPTMAARTAPFGLPVVPDV